MARLESPTSIDLAGPWLIEARHLLALDKLYDEYAPRLEEARQAWIDEQIEEYVEQDAPEGASADTVNRIRERIAPAIRGSSRFTRSRRASVYLSGGRTLQAERFSEILNHATVPNEVPLGFRSSLTVPRVEVVVKVGERTWGGHTLDISVEPNTNPDAQELYGALRNWVSDFQPPRWLQLWRKYGWMAAVFLFIFPFVFLLNQPQPSVGAAARQEAHKILSEGGVTPANQTRAIELLLAIESNYGDAPAAGPGPRMWATLILSELAALCISFCPKIVIGIWGGKARLERWRIWVRLVSISIPAMVISSLAMPWILKWFGLLP
jgi:hypothetical protein